MDAAESGVDETWYGATYPQAVAEVARGLAGGLAEHYARFGRARGYLPRLGVVRPDNPATHRSRFGGLWIDLANAADLLNGKLEIGVIDERQHALLSAFIRDGYVVLPGAVAEPRLSAAREALERVYDGGDPEQWFICEAAPTPFTRWTPEVRDHPAKAVEIHWRSRAVLDAVLSPAIGAFLSLIFERRAMISQTLGFYRGSAQAVHQDSAYVAYSLYTQFAASWLALEDVSAGAGELCYYPGSQTFPEHLFLDRYKVAAEALRIEGNSGPPVDTAAYERSLPRMADERGIPLQTFMAKAGDVLIWASELAHGGSPISRERSRKSVVTHYCPAELAPGYFEQMTGREIRRHENGHYYTSWA